jgi:hypothetical protein
LKEFSGRAKAAKKTDGIMPFTNLAFILSADFADYRGLGRFQKPCGVGVRACEQRRRLAAKSPKAPGRGFNPKTEVGRERTQRTQSKTG